MTGRERLRAMSPAWRRGWVGAAAALVAMTIAWRLLPESAAARADRLLAQGQAAQALPLIEQALLTQTRDAPDLHALRAAALHQLQRHDEEAAALRAHLHQALYSANERLIEALAEDFGRNEDDPQVREFLAGIPAGPLHKKLAALAQRPASTTQWGALRYLDLASGAGELDREALYSAALESSSCRMRISAARRLSEIGTANAIPALRKLSETPKEDWAPPEQGCGQDEAADAIRTLKKRAALGVR